MKGWKRILANGEGIYLSADREVVILLSCALSGARPFQSQLILLSRALNQFRPRKKSSVRENLQGSGGAWGPHGLGRNVMLSDEPW